jgi:hypothetical protein
LNEQESVHQEVEYQKANDGFTQKTWLVELNVAKVKRLKRFSKVCVVTESCSFVSKSSN